jgi:esterase/lipase
LICHGDQDRLSNETVARQLYDAVGAKDKTLKIFTAKDSGVEHCQVDNRQVGTDYIADWLAARFSM